MIKAINDHDEKTTSGWLYSRQEHGFQGRCSMHSPGEIGEFHHMFVVLEALLHVSVLDLELMPNHLYLSKILIGGNKVTI